jgi:hypothetical protein
VSVELKPISEIKLDLGIEPDGPVQTFFTQLCAIHMDKYVPFDTGALAETAVVDGGATTNVSSSYITYSQPYAHRIYEGDGYNFNKDMHPLATSRWDKQMVSAEMSEIEEELQKFIDRGVK